LFRPFTPAIAAGGAGNHVDTRVKPAHDDLRLVGLKIQQPISVPRTAPHFRGNGDRERAGIERVAEALKS